MVCERLPEKKAAWRYSTLNLVEDRPPAVEQADRVALRGHHPRDAIDGSKLYKAVVAGNAANRCTSFRFAPNVEYCSTAIDTSHSLGRRGQQSN
jgi:hypothetical protein